MADYEFVTIWRFKAPQEKVWDLIFHSENWPEWWRGVEKVERLKDGDANHIGAIHRYTWKSKLPYRLIFEMETTRVEPMLGDRGPRNRRTAGRGRWQFSHETAHNNSALRLEGGDYQGVDEPARADRSTVLQLEPQRGDGLGR